MKPILIAAAGCLLAHAAAAAQLQLGQAGASYSLAAGASANAGTSTSRPAGITPSKASTIATRTRPYSSSATLAAMCSPQPRSRLPGR